MSHPSHYARNVEENQSNKCRDVKLFTQETLRENQRIRTKPSKWAEMKNNHLPKTTHEYSKLPPSSSIWNKSLVGQGDCIKENESLYFFILERTIYVLHKSFFRLGRDSKPREKIMNLILSRFARACTTIPLHKSSKFRCF